MLKETNGLETIRAYVFQMFFFHEIALSNNHFKQVIS